MPSVSVQRSSGSGASRSRPHTDSLVVRTSFPTMGTMASIAVAASDRGRSREGLAKARWAISEVLAAADNRFSRYKPESELQQVRGKRLRPSDLSGPMRAVMVECGRLEEVTCGAFQARDEDGRFDPTGLVKGWATERAVAAAVDAGVENVCLNVGGDVRSAGRPTPERNWRVLVPDSTGSGSSNLVLAARDSGAPFAVATSSQTQRGTHIWDRNGRAAEPSRLAVTTVGRDAGLVDAVATAIWAEAESKDCTAALELLDSIDGVDGVLFCDSGVRHESANFAAYRVN